MVTAGLEIGVVASGDFGIDAVEALLVGNVAAADVAEIAEHASRAAMKRNPYNLEAVADGGQLEFRCTELGKSAILGFCHRSFVLNAVVVLALVVAEVVLAPHIGLQSEMDLDRTDAALEDSHSGIDAGLADAAVEAEVAHLGRSCAELSLNAHSRPPVLV